MTMNEGETETMTVKVEESVRTMFAKIVAVPTAYFKSQQRGEPDLSDSEKHALISDLYEKNCTQFLYRYHSYLDSEDVPNFDKCPRNYEVGFC